LYNSVGRCFCVGGGKWRKQGRKEGGREVDSIFLL